MIAIEIPEEVYTMKAKRSIIKCNAKAYRKASKAKKKEILNPSKLKPIKELYRDRYGTFFWW